MGRLLLSVSMLERRSVRSWSCALRFASVGGGRIQVAGNLHGVIGAWLASALSQRISTKH